MRHTPPKPLCWLLVSLLLFEWSGAMGWLPSGHAAQPVSLALPSTAELAKAGSFTPQIPPRSSVKPDELVARTEALMRSVPRVRYDLAARAQALGPGVDPAFRFVRDQIRFEAYPGVLRGAEGTYVTRAGNAFDRSLLLADLLKRKGVKTRFAFGKLPRPQADRLFARIFAPAPALEANAVSKALAFGQADREVFMARLRARAVRDYAAIRKALGDALPSKPSPSREEVLREIEGHVWMQAEVNGRWVDLDTAFGDAVEGRTYAALERTVEALPKESYQRVTIRVISETLTGGSLKTEIALEFSAAAQELLDRQIFLTHMPGGAGGGLAGAISGAAAGPDAWMPMLWVDGEFHQGKSVAFNEQAKPAERGRPPGGGLGGLFGAGGALSASSQIVAELIEFEIAFPDGRREVTRRALVDRAGMAWRQVGKLDAAGLRPLPRDAEGLTPPRALHNIWFSAGHHNLADYADALRFLAQWMKSPAEPDASAKAGSSGAPASDPSLTFGEQVWPLAVMNFSFLVHSDHVVVPALHDSPAHRFYAHSPRILIVSAGPSARAGDTVGGYIQYDLRRDHLRGLAREASGETGIVERKIWFGALQGALEHETVVQYAVAAGTDESVVTSTSTLLTVEGAVAFRPGAVPASQLPADRERATRIAQALKNGAILVIPRRVLREGLSGWWEIAANGAETRAVLGYDLNGAGIGWPSDAWEYRPVPPDWVKPLPPQATPPPGAPGWDPRGPIPGPGPGGAIPQDPGPPGGPPTRIDPRPPIGRPHKGPPRPVVRPRPPPPRTNPPGGTWRVVTKDECKKRGSLSTPGIRVAMASPLPPGLLDGHGRESAYPPLLLAQTATESTLVTECVAKPAVGVAALAIPILAFASLAIGAAVLGYLIGSNL